MITLDQVSIRQGDFRLFDVDFRIPSGGYGILMGSSGCGKTTLLEAICGLRPVCDGRILLDDREVTRISPAAREIGYVPQDAALFPTMRVDRQIEFGMEVRRICRSDRRQRVEQLAELLGLKLVLKRYPTGLSGGERQRVALARALAFRPKLLCLDEPLNALDATTHLRLLELLKEVHQKEGVTVLHVTHNVEESQNLGTVHFCLEKGTVHQS